MDFDPTDDQLALAEGVASLCAGRFDIETVRAAEGTGGIDRGRWQELADTGVFGIARAEADGGVGLGWADSVIVFEQLGRFLVPGPLVATTAAAGTVAGAIDGSTVVGMIERGDGPQFVEHLDVLDVLVVVDADGVWQIDPAALDWRPVQVPTDPLTPVGIVEALPSGDRIADAADADRWRAIAVTLTAALELGVAMGATDLAVAYAKERQQFGKPIGQFQAVKHLLADMASHVEVARAAVYAAGVTLDDPSVGDAQRAASAAKLVAGQAAAEAGKSGVQVHGGMGFTWEVDAHLFLKRAWALDQAFGDADHHADALALTV